MQVWEDKLILGFWSLQIKGLKVFPILYQLTPTQGDEYATVYINTV